MIFSTKVLKKILVIYEKFVSRISCDSFLMSLTHLITFNDITNDHDLTLVMTSFMTSFMTSPLSLDRGHEGKLVCVRL